MIEKLKKRNIVLTWLNGRPEGIKKIALLIPQFNEGKSVSFKKRLDYFNMLAINHGDILDVILIDDGSTDESFFQINNYINLNAQSFYFASISQNTKKVGALYLVSNDIEYEYVILSDFDTDLVNLDKLTGSLKKLDRDPELMGCYFKMIPFGGGGIWLLLQQLEYSFARIYYKFHSSEKSVPVMPGAGSCFKRECLLKLYALHSGRRNGEDREATIIGLQMGYKTMYVNDILAMTRPPLTFRALLTQRKRWYLGYIETFFKEMPFYFQMMFRVKRIGIRTFQDGIGVLTLLLLPIEILILSSISLKSTAVIIIMVYLISLQHYFSLFVFNPEERSEIKDKGVWILIYPFFWLVVSFFSWWKAALAFIWEKKGEMDSSNKVKTDYKEAVLKKVSDKIVR